MKDKIMIIGIIASVIGLVLFMSARNEIQNNSRYTWTKSYTSYEEQVLQKEWLGIGLLVIGIGCVGSKIYANKHIQDIDQLTQRGGSIKCTSCGLAISADVKTCPRCGKDITKGEIDYNNQNTALFCSKCGNPIDKSDLFCKKCGNKNI